MSVKFTERVKNSVSVNASADLSANQYLFHKVDSSSNLELAGAADRALGILQNKPDALGVPAEVAIAGDISLLKIAGTIAAGADIESDAAGKGVVFSAGARCALALEGGVVNDLIKVLILVPCIS